MSLELMNRSCHLVYRCSLPEKELTQVHAAKMGLSVSAYVRQTALFMIMLEGSPEEVLGAIEALGSEALPMVKNKLRYLESLL